MPVDMLAASGMRVGVVGCGKMGKEHARVAAALGGTVSLVHDPDHAKARELADGYPGCRIAETVGRRELEGLDAVIVASPPAARGPVELAAIRLGLPFLAEKPIGTSATQVAAILSALQAQPVLHSVGYMNRYRRSVAAAKARAGAEPLLGITSVWVGPAYRRSWWLREEESGGPLNEQATHLVDLCRYIAGAEVEAVVGLSGRGPQAGETTGAVLQFAGGVHATLLYSYAAEEKTISLELIGRAQSTRLAGWHLSDNAEGEAPEDVFVVQDSAFYSAVSLRDSSPIRSSFPDAYRTQVVVDAIKRALLRHDHVAVTYGAEGAGDHSAGTANVQAPGASP